MEDFEHGATDSGAEPLADFSTCAHPFGPCPEVLAAVLLADRTRYPDPAYARLREQLGSRYGVEPDRIVPGAGASELILRLVRNCTGDVLAWTPSFVEYRRAAQVSGRRFLSAREPTPWLDRVPTNGTAFLCQPNNPDGHVHSLEFLEAAAATCRWKRCRLVLDLAYADFCLNAPPIPTECDILLAPNKMFGLTGVRAGLVVSSDRTFAESLRLAAPAWSVGAEGVAFLAAASEPSAMVWFQSTLPDIWSATDSLRCLLEGEGWEIAPLFGTLFLRQTTSHCRIRLRCGSVQRMVTSIASRRNSSTGPLQCRLARLASLIRSTRPRNGLSGQRAG
jgi:histidinol-phosphate aminotransferase